jgi:hypothetical protein
MNPCKCLSQKAFSNTPALGVVFCGDTGFGQGVEKCGFAHIGQTHDAALEAHEFFPCKSRPQLHHRTQHGCHKGARYAQISGYQRTARNVKNRAKHAFFPAFVLGFKLMIVLISESLLMRSKGAKGRILLDRIFSDFGTYLNAHKLSFLVATSDRRKQFHMRLTHWHLMSIEDSLIKAMEVLHQ